ncbi:ethanolamine ammonia-lyase subunit EutC [Methylorubrum populi]
MRERQPVRNEAFDRLRRLTPARVGLGRAGQGLPTESMLEFQLAHARAQDAVRAELDLARLGRELPHPFLVVESAAGNRATYLQRPDLGRRLSESVLDLPRGGCDLAIVLGDGLSATAVEAHAPPLLAALLPMLAGWTVSPVIVARQARVALGDPIGERLGARCVLMLIGERPGLSAADSLGAYLTWNPIPGRRDSERNCVSNIRTRDGLHPLAAADKILWLLNEARRLSATGIVLKDRHVALPGDEASIRWLEQ